MYDSSCRINLIFLQAILRLKLRSLATVSQCCGVTLPQMAQQRLYYLHNFTICTLKRSKLSASILGERTMTLLFDCWNSIISILRRMKEKSGNGVGQPLCQSLIDPPQERLPIQDFFALLPHWLNLRINKRGAILHHRPSYWICFKRAALGNKYNSVSRVCC